MTTFTHLISKGNNIMQKVIGIEIDLHPELNADIIGEMTQDALRQIIDEDLSGEVYTLSAFFNYLNNDQIDTENYWWVVVD